MSDFVQDLLAGFGPGADPPLHSAFGVTALTVHGSPAPQGSKRYFGNGRMTEDSTKVRPWRDAIKAEVLRRGMGYGIDWPVSVRVSFVFERPKSHHLKHGLRANAPQYKGTTPDLDKLCRSTLDGLVDAGLLADDKHVVVLHAQKRYGDWSGAMIIVEPVQP